MSNLYKPASRQSNIVVNELEKELLIYDLNTSKALCLNQTSALVYQLADGTKTVAEISREMSVKLKTAVSDDLVWLALDGLKKDNLLENAGKLTNHFAGLTRREAVKKVGLASMVILPVITGLIAPTAASAVSCAANGAACTFSNNTQSNCCNSNRRCFTTDNNPATCMNCYVATTPVASCRTAGCCNLRSDRNQCCSGTFNEAPPTMSGDRVCSCAP